MCSSKPRNPISQYKFCFPKELLEHSYTNYEKNMLSETVMTTHMLNKSRWCHHDLSVAVNWKIILWYESNFESKFTDLSGPVSGEVATENPYL